MPQSPIWSPPPLFAVERAAGDLRRGAPVVIAAPDGPVIAAAAETAEAPVRDGVRAGGSGRLDLVLTHPRAQTLKIRLYTEHVVAVPLARGEDDVARIRGLADPTRDLEQPLKGPFTPRREALPAAYAGAAALARLGGLLPAVLAAPLGREAEGLSSVTLAEIAGFETEAADRLAVVARARVPLLDAEATTLIAFRPAGGGQEHLALVIGAPDLGAPVLARLHSECFTGDLLGSLKCDCGAQLRGAIRAIAEDGGGVLLYLAQEGRGIGLMNKLKAYALQDQGFDTVEANARLGFADDERAYRVAARMFAALGVRAVRLLTNNPAKIAALEAHGVTVAERVAHAFPANPHNAHYLAVKAGKSGHLL